MPSSAQLRRAQILKARLIQENLGHKQAVSYLKTRGWSCEGVVAVLCIH